MDTFFDLVLGGLFFLTFIIALVTSLALLTLLGVMVFAVISLVTSLLAL